MSDEQLRRTADNADFIVNGYAFTCRDGRIRVLNLSSPTRAAFLAHDGTMLETSMDDIELGIVQEYLARNKEFLAA